MRAQLSSDGRLALSAEERWAAMSEQEAVAMALAAPRVARAWDFSGYPTFATGYGEVPCWVRGHPFGAASVVLVDRYHALSLGKQLGEHLTLEAAQSACDAHLRAAGYVLEESP